MRLKRCDDVEWFDLPNVESPSFARIWAESNLHVSGPDICWIQGLDDVVYDDLAAHHPVWDNHARLRLLERIESAEVILVHGLDSRPLLPIVYRDSEESNDIWKVDSSLSLNAQFNLQRMLQNAYRTRGILSAIIEPRQAATRPVQAEESVREELTVTNPRWEHTDQERGNETPESTVEGDIITLKVDVNSAADGSRVTFKVYDTSIEPASRVGLARGEVQGGTGSAVWEVRFRRDNVELEFEGAVRRVSSERADIVVLPEFEFSL